MLLTNGVELSTSEVLEASGMVEDLASCVGTIGVLVGAATVLVDNSTVTPGEKVEGVSYPAVDRSDVVDEACVSDVDEGTAEVELLNSSELKLETDCPAVDVVVGTLVEVSAFVVVIVCGSSVEDPSVCICELPGIDGGVDNNDDVDDAAAGD